MFPSPTTAQFLTVQFLAIITAMWFVVPHAMFYPYIPKHFPQQNDHCQPPFISERPQNIVTSCPMSLQIRDISEHVHFMS